MKRLASIISWAVVCSALFVWITQSFLQNWEPRLRQLLQAQLSQALRTRVTVDNIAVLFFHRVRLDNVQVFDPADPQRPVFRAADISLTLSLIDLPRAIAHGEPAEAIGLVSVHTPWISVSPQTLKEFQRRPQSNVASHGWPLLFTLQWDHGTFQWHVPEAPHGAWTLYQGQGRLAIRGPTTLFAIRGSLPAAEQVRFQFGAFGRRWNAQAFIKGGDVAGGLELIQQILKHPILPPAARAAGRMELELYASGRRFPQSRNDIWRFLHKGKLFLSNAELRLRPGAPPFLFTGGLRLSGSRLSCSRVSLNFNRQAFVVTGSASPVGPGLRLDLSAAAKRFDLGALDALWPQSAPLAGIAELQMKLTGFWRRPELTVDGSLSQGRCFHIPIQNGRLVLHEIDGLWDVTGSRLQTLGGEVKFDGQLGAEASKLAVNGEGLRLDNLQGSEKEYLGGRIRFASTVRGPLGAPQAAGSFWIDGLVYGDNSAKELRGNFEASRRHAVIQADSDEGTAHLLIEAAATDDGWRADPIQLELPSGANIDGRLSLRGPALILHGDADIARLSVPGDLPFVARWVLPARGTVSGHGRLTGTLSDPRWTADLASDDVTVANEPPTHASGHMVWTSSAIGFPQFKTTNGLAGGWTQSLIDYKQFNVALRLSRLPAEWLTPLIFKTAIASGPVTGSFTLSRVREYSGQAQLALADGYLGAWPVESADINFDLKPGRFTVSRLRVSGRGVGASLEGAGWWSGASPIRFKFHGLGNSGPSRPMGWESPVAISGSASAEREWSGSAAVDLPAFKVGTSVNAPLHADLSWDRYGLRWTNAAWGRRVSSQGQLVWGMKGKPAVWDATLGAHQIPLAPWLAPLLPNARDRVHGSLSGTVALSGPLSHPTAQIQGQIEQGRWRSFRFENQVTARWTAPNLDPLIVTGISKDGGDFRFQGKWNTATQALSGRLQLSNWQLRPLGESLALPQPLIGIGQATLEVEGTPAHPRATGRIQGGPIIYGRPQEHPIHIEQFTFNAAVAPAPDDPSIVRLTLQEGLLRTTEEQLRWAPGSFVEFAGARPARLLLSSQIRNLHLGPFTVFGGLDLAGTWRVTPTSFDIRGDAQTHGLFINDYELEEGHLSARYVDGVLSFGPQGKNPTLLGGAVDFRQMPALSFQNFYIAGRDGQGLRINGVLGAKHWDFLVKGEGLDLAALGNLAGFPYPLAGTASVGLHGTGDSAHPHVDGSLALRDGSVLGLRFDKGAAAFVWQDTRMTFTRLQLSDAGRYTLAGAGFFPVQARTAGASEDNAINFSIRLIDSNLGLLRSLSDEVKQARGTVDGLLQITGTADQPLLKGHFQAAGGDVVGAHFFRHLQNFRLAADFQGNQLMLHELSGKSGNGTFKIDGAIALAGFEPRAYELKAEMTGDKGKGLEVQVPELAIPESPLAKRFRFLTTASRADVRGHFAFKGPAESPAFTGECAISNGHFTFPPSQKNPPSSAMTDWFRRIRWDVALKLGDGAWFENELVEASLSGKLALRGPSDRLRVDGGIDVTEGKISYLGVDFDLKEARLDMRSTETDAGVVNTPYIRGVAESQVQAVDTVSGQASESPGNQVDVTDTIRLTIDYAPIDQIKPRLTSTADPGLSQDKVLARVTQFDTDNLTTQEKTYLYQQQMVRLIDTGFVTPLARNLLKRTGLVSDVRVSRVIDPTQAQLNDATNGGTAQSQSGLSLLANTKYTFERNLSTRLSLGYGVRFEPTLTPDLQQNKLDLINDVELSYRWFSNVFLRGSFDLPSSDPSVVPDRKITIEPRWRFGWWGNTNKDKTVKP